MASYKRITFEEREEISRLLESKTSLRAIARALKRSPSSICRETKHHSVRTSYRAISGQRNAKHRSALRRFGKTKITKTKRLEFEVHKKLRLFWSPDQIAKHLKNEYESSDMHLSAESIYTYIYVLPRGELREELIACLRDRHKKRRTQGRSAVGQTANLEDMLSIEERPKEVADRIIPGHWEGDLVIGNGVKQTAIGTLVERTTRSVILVPLKNKTALEVRKAFAKELKKIPAQMRLTMTYDQGREMAQHKLFTKDTQMQVYFAHPRSPWERGTNENTNRLIRQFFPKNTDFTKVSVRELKRVQRLLNERPRKTLAYRTPIEVFNELLR
jgi:IS30 family transposase